MLVVMAIVGIILGGVVAFFSQQVGLSRSIQAENELNTRVRSVAEAIAQDLQLAGARAVADDAGRAEYVQAVSLVCSDEDRDGCVVVDQAGTSFDMSIVYASSLWIAPGESVRDPAVRSRSCRIVRYVLVGDELYRADAPCATPGDGSTDATFANLFAEGVEAISVDFVCDDAGVRVTNPTGCDAGRFVREGRVAVTGASSRGADALEIILSANMPNMRPAQEF